MLSLRLYQHSEVPYRQWIIPGGIFLTSICARDTLNLAFLTSSNLAHDVTIMVIKLEV
jgi:hypothetical protein